MPQTYDPAKTYQLRVQLHGGVGRPDPTPRGNGIGQLAGVEQIYLLPTAWGEAEWWTDPQLNNLRALLDSVKRTYNIDENRVVLSGVSDGGTATYYFSMRDTTPFAAFLPLNGAIPVLRNTLMRIDGELFMNNMVNKPFFIVNGGKDPLYPTTLVEPYIQQMQKGGVELTYLPQPEAVHNTAWWPEVKDTYEQFVKEHPRKPLPDTLTWESDLRANTGRAHWLVIDTSRADSEGSGAAAGPERTCRCRPEPDFGVRVSGARITSVTTGSNADSFGLLPGDVVAKIDNRVVPLGHGRDRPARAHRSGHAGHAHGDARRPRPGSSRAPTIPRRCHVAFRSSRTHVRRAVWTWCATAIRSPQRRAAWPGSRCCSRPEQFDFSQAGDGRR